MHAGVRYLGVDCGGSKSRWSWWPEDAGRGGVGPAVQPAVQGFDQALLALAAVLRQATATAAPEAAVVALAGVGDAAGSTRVGDALRRAGFDWPIAAVGDVLAAAAAALAEGPGVLVWSGTGSFAVARGADGRLQRAGGRGYLLGDQGSGYDLVRRGAAAVVLATDGLAPPTALGDALGAAFGAPPARLGAVLQQLPTGAVAAQLPVVLRCAALGDPVAGQVLDEGVDALVMVANAAVRSAGLDWRGLRTVLGGGVMTGAPPVRERVQQRLQAFGADTPVVADEHAGARGAAALARAWHQGQEPLGGWVDDVAL